MAYIVTYDDDYLFDPYSSEDVIYDASVSGEVNAAGYFDFSITSEHRLYNTIEERAGIVKVYSDNKMLFMGEISDIEEDFYGNKTVSCVDPRDHLNDVMVRPYSTIEGEQNLVAPSSVDGYFQWLIDQYNKGMINPKFHFQVGINQGAYMDKDNYIYRSSEDFPTVGAEIEDQILDALGGYLTLTYPDGIPTLNLYSDVHEANTQIIDFGVNLLDFTKTTATSEQYTAVRPEGGTPDKEESDSDNLVEGTRDWSQGRGSGSKTTEKYMDFVVLMQQARSSETLDAGSWDVGTVQSEEKYTLSFYMRTDNPGINVYSYFYPGTVASGSSSQGSSTTASDGKILIKPTASWNRYTITWTTLKEIQKGSDGKQVESSIIVSRLDKQTNGGKVYIAGVKFEQNAKATAWSPASEDDGPPPITIESLGDGVTSVDSDYIKKGDVVYCLSAVNRYGYKEYNWQEGNTLDKQELLEKAVADLKKVVEPKLTLEVKAVDMALFMDGYDHLECGQVARVRSLPHGVDEYLLVSSMEIDLQDPSQTTYTLGQAFDSLTGEQSSFVKSLNAGINSSLDAVAGLTQDVKDNAIKIDGVGNAVTEVGNKADNALDLSNEASQAAQEAWDQANSAQNAAQGAADLANQANQDLEEVRTWIDDYEDTVNSVTQIVNEIQIDMGKTEEKLTETAEKAQSASDKADALVSSIEEVNTTIEGLDGEIDGMKVTVEAAKSAADSAVSQVSQTQTDLDGFKTSVSQNYSTKKELDDAIAQEVLDRNAALKVGLDGISATVSENYTELTGKVSDAQSDASTALEAAQSAAEDLTNFSEEISGTLGDLQSQIDGSVQTWFYAGVPTLANAPANEWTDSATRNNHLGDLYYDTTTGYAYHFVLQNGTYSWNRISDSDVTKALQAAAKAQDTADHKRRVFVSTPKPPYDVGDLWVQGSGGDIKRCQTAKTASQSYTAADWILASKYTDDTKANAVENALNGYKTTVANTYSTKAELTTTKKSILAEVSESYTSKEVFDNLTVGGTNLLFDSLPRGFSGGLFDSSYRWQVTEGEYGKIGLTQTAPSTYPNAVMPRTALIPNNDEIIEHVGRSYTFSADFYIESKTVGSDVTFSEFWYGWRTHKPDGYRPIIYIDGLWDYFKNKPIGEWFRVSETHIIPSSYNGQTLDGNLQFHSSAKGTSITLRIRNVKLEWGNKATDWDAASKDLETILDNSIAQEVIDRNAAIKVESTAIQQSVSQKYATKDALADTNASITTTKDNILSQVAATYATRNELSKNNLIKNPDFHTNTTNWYSENGSNSRGTDANLGTYASFVTATRFFYSFPASQGQIWTSGVSYEYSFMAKCNTTGGTLRPSRSTVDYSATTHTIGTTWKKFSGIIECKTTAASGETLSFTTNGSSRTFYITDVYLAPLDYTAISASKSYVDQKADSITSTVESSYNSLNNKFNSYYTKTQIDQQKDSIESSISVAVDNIDIGAKNMLRESNIPNRGHSSTSYPAASYPIQGGVISGEQYTWTVRGTFTNATKMAMYFTGGTYGTAWVAIPGNGTHTIHLTFTANSDIANNDSRADFYVRDSRDTASFNGTAVITWAKLEKGNKSTDWSPAPEDVETELTSIRQDLDSIDLKVADLDGNQSDFQVTVNGFEARLKTAEGNATTAKNNASTALNTANTAKSTADSANSKATTAQSTANTANSTASSAKTTATNAQNTANSANSTANTAKTTATNAQNTANTANSTANAAKSTADTLNARSTQTYSFGGASSAAWARLGTLKTATSNTVDITVFAGIGYNGTASQNSKLYITIRDGNHQGAAANRYGVTVMREGNESNEVQVRSSAYGTCEVWIHFTGAYANGSYSISKASGVTWTHSGTVQTSAPTSGTVQSQSYMVNGAAAAKTATNYLKFDSTGLTVGNVSGTLQGNTHMTSNAVEVRNGTTVLSSFGASTIELGKNSSNSVINMAGGTIRLGRNNSVPYFTSTSATETIRVGSHLQTGTPGGYSEYGQYSGKFTVGNNELGVRKNSSGTGTLEVRAQYDDGDTRLKYFSVNLYKFGERLDTHTLWTGNIGKNGTGTLQVGRRFDDWRIFAIRLGADNIFLLGTRRGKQIHASNGTDDGSSSYIYVCQIEVTSETTFKLISGSSHKITAIDSAAQDKALNLSEIVGVC